MVAAVQVVELGAGLDSRAWRLPLPPATAWFEVGPLLLLSPFCAEGKLKEEALHGQAFVTRASEYGQRALKVITFCVSRCCAALAY